MLGRSLKKSLLRHVWGLAENVAIVSLVDPNVDTQEKKLMIQKLMKYPYPEGICYFAVRKTRHQR